jgi:predicted RecA/RadA family phage recombinase
MAKNRLYARGTQFPMNVSAKNGSGTADLVLSGDPIAFGPVGASLGFGCVALTTENSAGISTVQTDGIFNLAVTGKNAADADTAVAIGDTLYWDNTPGQLNLDGTNGIRFGYALAAVVSGATTVIAVKVGY